MALSSSDNTIFDSAVTRYNPCIPTDSKVCSAVGFGRQSDLNQLSLNDQISNNLSRHNITRLALRCTAGLLLAGLVACGGGGGGGSSSPKVSSNLSTLPMEITEEGGKSLTKAAGAKPIAGSVLQASNTDPNNVTVGSVSYLSPSRIGNKIAIKGTVTAGSDRFEFNTGALKEDGTREQPTSGLRVTRSSVDKTTGIGSIEVEARAASGGEDGTLWVDFYVFQGDAVANADSTPEESYSGVFGVGDYIGDRVPGGTFRAGGNMKLGDVHCTGGCGISNGYVTEGEFRVKNASSSATQQTIPATVNYTQQSDWLAGGVWLWMKDNPASIDDYSFGAFTDISDSLKFGEYLIGGLEGEATYTGASTGIYSSKDGAGFHLGYFDAVSALTADFGDAVEMGTISGSINNITKSEGTPSSVLAPGVSTVTLGQADITDSQEGGFFTGNTSAIDGMAGKWGGQFYGEYSTPDGVLGTFGAANDNVSLLGVFYGE